MNQDKAHYRLALKIFVDFTSIMVIPAVVGAVAGKWLDVKYGTFPRYVAMFLLLAFLSTSLLIVKKAIRYRQQYVALIDMDDKDKENIHTSV